MNFPHFWYYPELGPMPQSPSGCGFLGCPNKWVTIGSGHDPRRVPVDCIDGVVETRFCAEHLAQVAMIEWGRSR
jgi:hypothetical protein